MRRPCFGANGADSDGFRELRQQRVETVKAAVSGGAGGEHGGAWVTARLLKNQPHPVTTANKGGIQSAGLPKVNSKVT